MIGSIWHRKHWPIIFVTLLAFALRIYNANGRPIWYDEAFAVLYAEKTFAQMWYGTVAMVRGAAADVHPLFYYTLLHLWMSVVGESAFAVRFLSAMFGMATVPVVYRLARALFDSRVAAVAALMLALSPFHIAYSQETRMYAQLGFFSALAVLAYLKYEQSRERRWWLLFVLSGAGAVYSHNLGILILLALGVWVLGKREWRLIKAAAAAGVSILLLWLPWLSLVPGQVGKIQQAYWVPRPDFISLLQTLTAFLVDFDNARIPAVLLPFGMFGALLLLAFSSYQVLRKRMSGAQFAFTLALTPPLLLFTLSQWQPLYLTRILIGSFLMFLVLAARLIVDLPAGPRYALSLALIVLAGISLFFYYPYAEFPRPPFRDAAAFLAERAETPDAIVHDNKLSFFPMHYYERGLSQAFIADPAGAGSDTLALPTQEALQLFASSLDDATNGKSRVWFVIFAEAIEQGGGNLNLLNKGYECTEFRHFNDLMIFLCQKKT